MSGIVYDVLMSLTVPAPANIFSPEAPRSDELVGGAQFDSTDFFLSDHCTRPMAPSQSPWEALLRKAFAAQIEQNPTIDMIHSTQHIRYGLVPFSSVLSDSDFALVSAFPIARSLLTQASNTQWSGPRPNTYESNYNALVASWLYQKANGSDQFGRAAMSIQESGIIGPEDSVLASYILALTVGSCDESGIPLHDGGFGFVDVAKKVREGAILNRWDLQQHYPGPNAAELSLIPDTSTGF